MVAQVQFLAISLRVSYCKEKNQLVVAKLHHLNWTCLYGRIFHMFDSESAITNLLWLILLIWLDINHAKLSLVTKMSRMQYNDLNYRDKTSKGCITFSAMARIVSWCVSFMRILKSTDWMSFAGCVHSIISSTWFAWHLRLGGNAYYQLNSQFLRKTEDFKLVFYM